MDFLSKNEISCHKNLRKINFYLYKSIKGEVLRHLSYKGQSHRAQQAPYGRYKLKMQKY